MRKMNNSPIGIFDSGIGGLTVVKEIVKSLPNESIIYLGDTARVPYGTRSKEIITKFAKDLANFLLKRDVKCLVVACNTVSSVALGEIERISSVPVIGVVKPVAKKAVSVTKNKKIGVIGTWGTIQSKAYELEINGIDSAIEVFSVSCSLFVPLAEEGFYKHQATKQIAEDYLEDIVTFGADTLILGCTHYPLLAEIISETVGPDVTLIDSAQPATEELRVVLENNDLLSNHSGSTLECFVTDAPERISRVAKSFFGNRLDGRLKRVEL